MAEEYAHTASVSSLYKFAELAVQPQPPARIKFAGNTYSTTQYTDIRSKAYHAPSDSYENTVYTMCKRSTIYQAEFGCASNSSQVILIGYVDVKPAYAEVITISSYEHEQHLVILNPKNYLEYTVGPDLSKDKILKKILTYVKQSESTEMISAMVKSCRQAGYDWPELNAIEKSINATKGAVEESSAKSTLKTSFGDYNVPSNISSTTSYSYSGTKLPLSSAKK